MSNLALSVSKYFFDKENRAPNKPDRDGVLSNRWAYAAFDNVLWEPTQIIEHVRAGHAICVASTKNNHRKGEFFKSAQLMGVDFDKGPGVLELLNVPLIDNYSFMVYATPSSTPEAPRSRALFALDKPICDPEEYKRLLKRLLLAFGAGNIDEQCKDTVRIFYGSAGRKTSDVPSAILPIDVLLDLPLHPDELPKPQPEVYLRLVEPFDSKGLTRLEAYAKTAHENILNDLAMLPDGQDMRHGAINAAVMQLAAFSKGGWQGFDGWENEIRQLGRQWGRAEQEIEASIKGAYDKATPKPVGLPDTGMITLNQVVPSVPAKVEPVPIEAPAKPMPPKAAELRPALPKFAQLTLEMEREAAKGRDWLNDYMDWAVDASPLTPRSFHEAMALWLLATVSTRRMHCRIGAEDIYPNLYVLIVGKTTIYRKSTAMKLVKSVLHQAGLNALLLPSDVTPEALFDELAGVKPPNFESLSADAKDRWTKGRLVAAQRSFMKDEASSIFASLKRDYMAGLAELLLQGYDGDSGTMDKRLKSKGIVTVKDLCLSFLGATTPIMYSKYVGNEEHENGFAARFAIITPERDMTYRNPTDQLDIPPGIVSRIGNLFRKVLPWHGGALGAEEVTTPPAMHVMFHPNALEQLNKYRRALGWDMPLEESIDDGKAASYARLGTMAFKVAMLLAAIDTDFAPIRVEERHAYAAQQVVESWRESLHRLDSDIAKAKNSGRDEDKVIALIRQSGLKGVTMREIMRGCNLSPRQKAVDALTLLADEGLIEKYEFSPGGRGRATTYFRISGLSESGS